MNAAEESWLTLIEFVSCLFISALLIPMQKNYRIAVFVGVLAWVFLYPSWAFAAAPRYSMQLLQVRVVDLARIVYGDVLRQSFVLDAELIQSSDVISLDWIDLSKGEVDLMTRDILKLHGFELVQKQKILLVRQRNDTDEDLLIYKPRFRSARYLSDILAKVADAQQLGARAMQGSVEFQQAVARQPSGAGSAGAMISQSAPDQLAYQCLPDRCGRLRRLLAELDTPVAQVVLRAAVYEVGTTQGEGSALQIAAKLFQGSLGLSAGSVLPGAYQLQVSSSNLDAVLSVLDQDGRFKSVSRPMLRVSTGEQAKFSVGQQVPVLGAVSFDQNGKSLQSVEYRQSGTIFTVQPDVRGDVVDLSITQELSSFVATTTGVNGSPTLLQRTASSKLSIRPGEVIVFAGLEEQKDDFSDGRLFGFSLGTNKNSTSSEVLLFIEAQLI